MMYCKNLTREIERLGGMMASMADGQKIRGTVFGPNGDMTYNWTCDREGKWGPGPCGSFRLERTANTARARALHLKPVRNVGNLYGLNRQLARDITRLFGCPLNAIGPETGFEGMTRRHPRRRR